MPSYHSQEMRPALRLRPRQKKKKRNKQLIIINFYEITFFRFPLCFFFCS
eukprot:UN06454